MYGLVNKAVEQLVKSNFGDAKWQEIAKKAGVQQSFIMMKSYPDQVVNTGVKARLFAAA